MADDDPEILKLYPFKFLDPVSKRWVKARYVAELHEIQARYEKWEITGEPELRRRGKKGDLGYST